MNPHSQHIDIESLGPLKIVDGNSDMINTLEIDLAHDEFSFSLRLEYRSDGVMKTCIWKSNYSHTSTLQP
jgi:hypothetical protein